MTDTPKPAPAPPAATPMAALREAVERALFGVGYSDWEESEQRWRDTSMHDVLVDKVVSEVAALQPAAAQPQRESEQPEQALREAVQDMMPLIELYAEREINSPANHQEFARQTEEKLGRLRAALSPQTDSQEPR